MRASLKIFFSTVLMLLPLIASALTPSPEFQKKEVLGSVTNFETKNSDVHIGEMTSDFKYGDLTQQNVDDLSELYEAKKEYGKMFGFKGWEPVEKKFFQDKSHRMLILRGHYKNADNKKIHFLEVYWANANQSKQFLITSEKKDLKVDEYKAYLK